MALGRGQRGRDQLLDGQGTGHDQAPPAGLVQKRRGDRGGARAGQRRGKQPSRDLASAGGSEVGEAEDLAQGGEVRVARLSARAVGGERLWAHADLIGHEAERRLRDRLAEPKRPARVAQRAQLQRETEPVVGAAAGADEGEILVPERPIPDEGGLVSRQGEQRLKLRLGEGATSRHGGVSQFDCGLSATASG